MGVFVQVGHSLNGERFWTMYASVQWAFGFSRPASATFKPKINTSVNYTIFC